MPVRWLDSMREMIDRGVTIFVEVGPGKVLVGAVAADRSLRPLFQRRGRREPRKPRSTKLPRRARKRRKAERNVFSQR